VVVLIEVKKDFGKQATKTSVFLKLDLQSKSVVQETQRQGETVKAEGALFDF